LEKIIVVGSMPKSIIRRIARSHRDELLDCYYDARMRHPRISGSVTVRYTVNSIGYLSKVSVKEATLKDKRMHRCLVRKIKKWRFPSAKGSGISRIQCKWKFIPPRTKPQPPSP
jgi:TonB family protein